MTKLQEEARAARIKSFWRWLWIITIMMVGSTLTLLTIWFLGLLKVRDENALLLNKIETLEKSQHSMVWLMDESCANQIQTSDNVSIRLIK